MFIWSPVGGLLEMTVIRSPLKRHYTFRKFQNSQKLFTAAKKNLHQKLQDKISDIN